MKDIDSIKHERNSSFELVKCIAIIFIVFSHGVYEVQMQSATAQWQIVILMIIHSLGQLGNSIFISCSAYFLIESESVKPSRIVHIIINSFIISMIFLAIYLAVGFEVPIKYIIKSFLPTIYGNWWFISCYLLLYIVHPYLNLIINQIGRSRLFFLCTFFIFGYSCLFFVTRGSGFNFTNIIGFIGIYFLVAYYKKFANKDRINKNKCVIIITICAVLLVLEISITNYIGLYIPAISGRVHMWTEYINPTIILMTLTIIAFASKSEFYNYAINKLSRLSLLVYLIHANFLTMDLFRPWYFGSYFTENPLVGGILYDLVWLGLGLMMAQLYSISVDKLVLKVSNKVSKYIKKVFTCFEKYIINKYS